MYADQEKPACEATRDLPVIPKELIDQFVNGLMNAEDIQDALMAFKKVLVERALAPSDRKPIRGSATRWQVAAH
jgi:hypothetical protein